MNVRSNLISVVTGPASMSLATIGANAFPDNLTAVRNYHSLRLFYSIVYCFNFSILNSDIDPCTRINCTKPHEWCDFGVCKCDKGYERKEDGSCGGTFFLNLMHSLNECIN